jgi:hypothetical protein
MLLYKYIRQNGIDLLDNLRLLFTAVSDLNDPFEYRPALKACSDEALRAASFPEEYLQYLYKRSCSQGYKGSIGDFRAKAKTIKLDPKETDKGFLQAIETVREKSGQTLLVASFCSADIKEKDDVLMWAHYAEDNTGLRITFDSAALNLSPTELIKIEYADERISINPWLHPQGEDDEMIAQIRKSITTKSTSWQYEEEYRWIVSPHRCIESNYVPLPAQAIIAVDAGVYAKDKFVLQVASSLSRKELSHVRLRKANVDTLRFKINYTDVEKNKIE